MAMVAAVASEVVAVAGKLLRLSWLPEVGEWGAGERAGVRGPSSGREPGQRSPLFFGWAQSQGGRPRDTKKSTC